MKYRVGITYHFTLSRRMGIATTLKEKMQLTHFQESAHRIKLAEHMYTQWKVNRKKARFIAWRTSTLASRAHKRDVLDRTLKLLAAGYLGRRFTI